jgi:hypothetical protein
MEEPLIKDEHSVYTHAGAKMHRGCKIPFPLLFWIVFALVTIFAVVDRYTSQLWLAGVDSPLRVGNWAVMFFDHAARISGRVVTVSTSVLFLTMCRTLWEASMPWFPRWIEVGDIRGQLSQIHYFVGIVFMAIPMLIHVWSLILPAMTGLTLTLSIERGSFYIPADPAVNFPGSVNFASNDLYRLILMTLLFGVVFPFTMSNLGRTKNFTLATWLHILGGLLYAIDIIRQPSHPHSQAFNTPFVFLWFADRLVGYFWFRRQPAVIVHKEVLDGSYVIVLLRCQNQKRRVGIGSAYWFSMPKSVLETSHAFTVFQNRARLNLFRLNKDASHMGHAFSVGGDSDPDRSSCKKAFAKRSAEEGGVSMQAMGDAVDFLANDEHVETDNVSIFDTSWNVGLVVAIHDRPASWTRRLVDAPIGTPMNSWGPYSTEYCKLSASVESLPPLVLIATGAGAAYIIDFVHWLSASSQSLTNPINVYFSTNSVGLFQFFTDLTCTSTIDPLLSVNAHLTRHDDIFEYDEDNYAGQISDAQEDNRNMAIGRLSFDQVLSKAPLDSIAYFCGSPTLQWQCEKVCARKGMIFREGHTFSANGQIKVTKQGKKILCKCTKFPCCWQL